MLIFLGDSCFLELSFGIVVPISPLLKNKTEIRKEGQFLESNFAQSQQS